MLDTEHKALYGLPHPPRNIAARMQHDLLACLVSILNLYGDLFGAPRGVLTWPKHKFQNVEFEVQQVQDALSNAHTAKADALYYQHIAAAVGHYNEALRQARNMAKTLRHKPLEHYTRAAQRSMQELNDPILFSDAVDGRKDRLNDLLLQACQDTRKRFGDRLRQQGIRFDPPSVRDEYVYEVDSDINLGGTQ